MEYVDNMIKASKAIIDDMRNMGIANIGIGVPKTKSNLDIVKLYSNNIVCDCLYFKTLKPPEKFAKIHNKINEACDIYIDLYSQLYEKIIDDDFIWLNRHSSKLIFANRLVIEATEYVYKIK